MSTAPHLSREQASAKVHYVVVDDNILGAVLPTNRFSAQVLATKHDAVTSWMNGTYPLPLDPAWVASADCPKPLDMRKVNAGELPIRYDPAHVRSARLKDFEAFRVQATGYLKDSLYPLDAPDDLAPLTAEASRTQANAAIGATQTPTQTAG